MLARAAYVLMLGVLGATGNRVAVRLALDLNPCPWTTLPTMSATTNANLRQYGHSSDCFSSTNRMHGDHGTRI